jgi:cytoskeletal protein CcmA (bactofilin family)
MIAVLSIALLALGTVGLFLLALLPALREHFARTDTSALRLSGEGADIRFFALSFQRYIDRQLPELRSNAFGLGPIVTSLSDRTCTWYSPPNAGRVTLFGGDSPPGNTGDLAAISEADVRVPDGTTVARELFTSGSFEGGTASVYRAVLAKGDASFGRDSTVVRWVDAGGALRVGRNSTLWGRASCWGTMRLDDGTRFQRLAAPRIEFGVGANPTAPVAGPSAFPAEPSQAVAASGRWLMDDDLTIREDDVVDGDIVITGTLTIGRGATINGSVRSGAVIAGDDCVFSGSIVATERLTVGERCRITGPVVVEGEAVIGAESRIGDSGDETTISALLVRVGAGVVLCGEVWARKQGIVGAGSTAPEPEPLGVADERALSW